MKQLENSGWILQNADSKLSHDELLDTDLAVVGAKFLPQDPNNIEPLCGPKVLQIKKVKDVGHSKISHDNGSQNSLFKIMLTDGHTVWPAINLEPLKNISGRTLPGTKVQINGVAQYIGGFLLLNNSNCKILGGRVDKLIAAIEMNDNISKKKSDKGGPPRFIEFQQSQSADPKRKIVEPVNAEPKKAFSSFGDDQNNSVARKPPANAGAAAPVKGVEKNFPRNTEFKSRGRGGKQFEQGSIERPSFHHNDARDGEVKSSDDFRQDRNSSRGDRGDRRDNDRSRGGRGDSRGRGPKNERGGGDRRGSRNDRDRLDSGPSSEPDTRYDHSDNRGGRSSSRGRSDRGSSRGRGDRGGRSRGRGRNRDDDDFDPSCGSLGTRRDGEDGGKRGQDQGSSFGDRESRGREDRNDRGSRGRDRDDNHGSRGRGGGRSDRGSRGRDRDDRSDSRGRGGRDRGGRDRDGGGRGRDSGDRRGGRGRGSDRYDNREDNRERQPAFKPDLDMDFPALPGGSDFQMAFSGSVEHANPPSNKSKASGPAPTSSGPLLDDDGFECHAHLLYDEPPSQAAPASHTSPAPYSVHPSRQASYAQSSNQRVPPKSSNQRAAPEPAYRQAPEDFPALGGSDFPALGGSTTTRTIPTVQDAGTYYGHSLSNSEYNRPYDQHAYYMTPDSMFETMRITDDNSRGRPGHSNLGNLRGGRGRAQLNEEAFYQDYHQPYRRGR